MSFTLPGGGPCVSRVTLPVLRTVNRTWITPPLSTGEPIYWTFVSSARSSSGIGVAVGTGVAVGGGGVWVGVAGGGGGGGGGGEPPIISRTRVRIESRIAIARSPGQLVRGVTSRWP